MPREIIIRLKVPTPEEMTKAVDELAERIRKSLPEVVRVEVVEEGQGKITPFPSSSETSTITIGEKKPPEG